MNVPANIPSVTHPRGPDMSARYAKPDHVGWVLDGESAIVMHLGTGEWIGLSAHAAQVWQLLMESGDPDLVVTTLAERYDVEPVTIARDVEPLIEDLLARDLLAEVDA